MLNISRRILLLAILGRGLLYPVALSAQDVAPPVLRAGGAAETLTIDGLLREPAWTAADAADAFTQTDPAEGAPATLRTTVRVLASSGVLVIGVMCEDDPDRIVSFSVIRDAGLQAEDHVRIVLGPFRDGRSGYVFAVNPRGARYDSLITSGGAPAGVRHQCRGDLRHARLDLDYPTQLRRQRPAVRRRRASRYSSCLEPAPAFTADSIRY